MAKRQSKLGSDSVCSSGFQHAEARSGPAEASRNPAPANDQHSAIPGRRAIPEAHVCFERTQRVLSFHFGLPTRLDYAP